MNIHPLESSISVRARALEASKIRAVAESAMGQSDVILLWFGEGAWDTNPLIVEAAVKSLRSGNHMYQPNNGSIALRDEICRYQQELTGTTLTRDRVTMTPSGMQGLRLVAELLVTPGDRVVVIEPNWPNIAAAFQNSGADICRLALHPKDGSWWLDINALLDMLTPETTAVLINSPNNPTGWAMPMEDQTFLLDHCRTNGIWVVSDDVYRRLYRHGNVAPSFLDIANAEDRLISANSFSKAWSMTGWRLGWIVAPAAVEAKLGQLTEFNTSCTAGFVQDAGVVALRDCEPAVTELRDRIQVGYQLTSEFLSGLERVRFIEPDGAFYSFFRVDGMSDSYKAATVILEATGVGLAPGIAFGDSGEGYLRLCYAQPAETLRTAFERLEPVLRRQKEPQIPGVQR